MLFGECARRRTRARWIVGLSVFGFLIAGVYFAEWLRASNPRHGTEPAAPARTRPIVPTDESRVAATFGSLPLSFEPNQGQTDAQVKFLSRNPGYNLFLTSNEAVFALPVRSSKAALPQGRWAKARQSHVSAQAVLRMKIRGANPAPTVSGNTPLEGHTNYLVGRNSSQWVRNVPQYEGVHYREIYPGIDLTFYGQQRQLEFDFIVKPGSDPAAIGLGIEGASRIRTDEAGDLVLT